MLVRFRAGHDPAAVRPARDRRLLADVVLVLDLAHQLLQHVLQRQQLHHPAVLADHEREMGPLPAKGGEHVAESVFCRAELGEHELHCEA